jgi:hypothetical protein
MSVVASPQATVTASAETARLMAARKTARSSACSGQMNASSQARAPGSARLTGCWSMPSRKVIRGIGPRIGRAGTPPRTSQVIVTGEAAAGAAS